MRLTITILCGTRAGQRFVVAEGELVRVGRTAKADVVIADDPTMSAVHFELKCGETGFIARDQESRNGLFINGRPVSEAVLAEGDQIRAGRTFFDVAVRGARPSSSVDPADETRAAGWQDATKMMPQRPPTEPGHLPPATPVSGEDTSTVSPDQNSANSGGVESGGSTIGFSPRKEHSELD